MNTIGDVIISAEDFRHTIDTPREYFNKDYTGACYKDFLSHKIKNHTRADIAMQKLYKKYPIRFPMSYERNMYDLEKVPEIDTLIKSANETYAKLYPKTGKLRKRLINADRFDFEKITPALKGVRKLLLRLRVLF